jgi:hypothetical protein
MRLTHSASHRPGLPFTKTPGTRGRAGLRVPLQLALARCSLELKYDFHSRQEKANPSATPFKVLFFLMNFHVY